MVLEPQAYETERHDLVTTDGIAPGAGNQFTWQVPANSVIHVLSVWFRYITSGAGAARRPYVAMTTGGIQTMQLCYPVMDQPLTMTYSYCFTPGVPGDDLSGLLAVSPATLTCAMRLQTGEQLRIGSTTLDAADVIDDIRFRYKLWKMD